MNSFILTTALSVHSLTSTLGHLLTILYLVKKPSPKPIFLDPSAGCGSLPETVLFCQTLHVAASLLCLCPPPRRNYITACTSSAHLTNVGFPGAPFSMPFSLHVLSLGELLSQGLIPSPCAGGGSKGWALGDHVKDLRW